MTRGSQDLLKTCRAAILDFDDTIVATFRIRPTSLMEALNDFSVKVAREQVIRHWGAPFADLISILAPNVDLGEFTKHYRQVMLRTNPELLPGAEDLLGHLRDRNIPRVVHSSSLTDLVRQDLKVLDIDTLVTDVFGSDRTVLTKPNPASLDVVLNYIEFDPAAEGDVVYIGDSIRDLQTAHGRGLKFIGVSTGQTTAKMFRDAGWSGPVVGSLLDIF